MTSIQESNNDDKLIDFDWQIKHVMGSSTFKSIEDTLTQLTFHTVAQSSSSPSTIVKKNITIEFNKSELKNLIATLQSMKQN